MNFYERLSEVYDRVFPVNEQMVNFLTDNLASGSRVLDIACGTGGYAAAIAELGHQVDAIDLDTGMIDKAKARGQLQVNWVQGDMTRIQDYWKPAVFDRIYCIGNSLVHLGRIDEVIRTLEGCRSLLKPGGQLIIGIVNFNLMLESKVWSLPTLERSEAGIRFERNYKLSESGEHILFENRLIIHNDGQKEQYENAVPLLPLVSEKLVALTAQAGFQHIHLYGNPKQDKFEPLKSPAVFMQAAPIIE
jgi:glycine/sarcosine N-methyltransferase